MKLIVNDIKVSSREVEVGEKCPNPECGADLTADDSVTIGEYIDASYRGRLEPSSDSAGGYAYGEQGFEWYGEDNITGTAFYCAKCDTTIAAGKREEEE